MKCFFAERFFRARVVYNKRMFHGDFVAERMRKTKKISETSRKLPNCVEFFIINRKGAGDGSEVFRCLVGRAPFTSESGGDRFGLCAAQAEGKAILGLLSLS